MNAEEPTAIAFARTLVREDHAVSARIVSDLLAILDARARLVEKHYLKLSEAEARWARVEAQLADAEAREDNMVPKWFRIAVDGKAS